jgi:hypothetical protein
MASGPRTELLETTGYLPSIDHATPPKVALDGFRRDADCVRETWARTQG